MSRMTSSARHRADTNGNIALVGLSRAAKNGASTIGRPVAIVAVASGLAFTAVGTANASAYTEQNTTTVPAAVVAPAAAPAPVVVPAPAAAAASTHTVVSGDTLGAISARYGVDLNAVLSANGLSVSAIIYPGSTIVIPTGNAASAPVHAAPVAVTPAAPVAAAAPAAPAAPVQRAAAIAPAPAAAASGVYLASTTPAPAPVASSGVAGTLVASAYGQIGTIQDCTAMVEKALRAAGFTVGDLGPSQFFQFGSTVATPAAGDLVITGGHVAIYVGGGKVVSGGMNGINATMEHPLSDLPGASFVRVG